MKKVVLFVFNGDPMCFIHVLLNVLDMADRGYESRIVIEGAATKLIPELEKQDSPLHKLWEDVKNKSLIAGICRACANKMGTIDQAKSLGLTLLDDMSGHPGIARYREQGYEVVTF